MSTIGIFYLAGLVLATFSATLSGVNLISSVEKDFSKRDAWLWTAIFVVSSVVAAFYFFRLVEGGVGA